MQIKKIKVGQWYETKLGVGKTERVGGCHPLSCRVLIVSPLPRGICNVVPRDFIMPIMEELIPEFELILERLKGA